MSTTPQAQRLEAQPAPRTTHHALFTKLGVALLVGLLALGCNRTLPPSTDPAAVEKEAERLKLEHQREMENRKW